MGPLHALLCWSFASGEGEKCTWGDPRLGTALWVGLISWSPEGDSNVCFVEVAFAGRAHWVFFEHTCCQDQDATQKCGGLLGVAFCCPMAAPEQQTP